jgi:hypothetical protein
MKALLACAAFATLALAGCATTGSETGQPTRTVAAIDKVVDSLAAETAQRLATEVFKGLPVVVRPGTGSGVEPAVAELLRTRLLERGLPVEVACPARCLDLSLIEFAVDATMAGGVTPGQIVTVATGAVPVLGGLSRTLAERERGGAPRTTALLVSFASRDGNRYTSRSHVIAIVSSTNGNVALERR